MVYLMAKRSHFYNLPTGLLNITPKAYMLKISFIKETFQSLYLTKRINLVYDKDKVIIP